MGNADLVARMRRERIVRGELLRDPRGELGLEPAPDVDRGELGALDVGLRV